MTGCGNNYRPVLTAINPVGPAAQPQKFAVVISQPSPTSVGLLTVVDFSGDTIQVTPSLGASPYYLALDAAGFTGFTLNGDSTVSSFDISTSLMTNAVQTTTLLPSSTTDATLRPSSIFSQGTFLYITQPNRSSVAQLESTPPTVRQELPIDPAFRPVYIAGQSAAPREYVISQNIAGGNGQVAAIETSSSTISTTIPVGVAPVYGVMTTDNRRAFITNSGSNSVSVINAQTNTIDTSAALPTGTIPVGVSPVWADLIPTRSEVAVLNAGDGTGPGSLSIISIPLCSVSALPTNPNCDPNNPVDATGFGQVLANVPVGVNPKVVAVLQDGTRAYVANAGNATTPGSVTVVNLTTRTVTATLPSATDATCTNNKTLAVCGHPGFIAATVGTPTGKVYVVSPDSTNLTVIRTDIDKVSTTVGLQGNGVQVRVTAP